MVSTTFTLLGNIDVSRLPNWKIIFLICFMPLVEQFINLLVVFSLFASISAVLEANNDFTITIEETSKSIFVLENDLYPSTITMTVLRAPNNGTAIVHITDPPIKEPYDVIYTPNYNFIGIDSFVYAISAGDGKISNATVIVGVRPYNEE